MFGNFKSIHGGNNVFVFHVRLDNHSAKILAVSWSGDWQQCKFDPDQSAFMSLYVIGEKGQVSVNHG